MKKFAIVSDIHANIEALSAVMDDIDKQGDVETIYCLGDVVGYGPDPEAVIDLIEERCEFCLMGNHDHALLTEPTGFNPIAAGAIEHQKETLWPGIFALPKKQHRWDWIKALEMERWIGPDIFVHASPRDKIYEYILPQDPLYAPEKLAEIFEMVPRRCYVGHTHNPGVFTVTPEFIVPVDIHYEYRFKEGEKLILNVSSVGQPRDRDDRACYATVTDELIRWHRVEYDIEETVKKVLKNPHLDDRCGLRLRYGR